MTITEPHQSSAPASSAWGPPSRPPVPPRRRGGLIAGALVGVAGLAALAAGGGIALAASHRDDAGFFEVDTERYVSSGYAVTSDDIDIGDDGLGGLDVGDLVRLRLEATASDADTPVFVGIGRTSDVDAYLRDVAHDVVDDVDTDRVDYRDQPGTRRPEQPEQQSFWAASTAATSDAVIWEPGDGDWTVVLMNADASPGVDADVEIGIDIRHLEVVAGSLLAVGALLASGGAALALRDIHGRRGIDAAADPGDVARRARRGRDRAEVSRPRRIRAPAMSRRRPRGGRSCRDRARRRGSPADQGRAPASSTTPIPSGPTSAVACGSPRRRDASSGQRSRHGLRRQPGPVL
jgi:hypothetical protein